MNFEKRWMCSNSHDEVCYDSRNCPVCDKQNELDAANYEIAELQKQVDDLNGELFACLFLEAQNGRN